MTQNNHLIKIGEITCQITGSDNIQFRHIDPVYNDFIQKGQSCSPKPDITISLQLSMIPHPVKEKMIFDNNINWIMYLEHGEYTICWQRQMDEEPTWVARFKPDLREVAVYCGNRLVKREKKTIHITSPFPFPLDQLLVMFALNKLGGALVHSAGMGINGHGVLFCGVSGAGKTTISRLFMEHKDVEVLSDDRIIVRKKGRQFRIYGTPWPGDARIARNKSLPLSSIFFLNQDPQNRITKLAPGDALKKILPVTSIQWYEKSMMTRSLRFLEKLVKHVPAYRLDFTPRQDAVTLVRKCLLSLQNSGPDGMMGPDHRGKSGK